jgi:hypothetical protein
MSVMQNIFGSLFPQSGNKPQDQNNNQPQVQHINNNPNNNPPPQGTKQSDNTAPNGVIPDDGSKNTEKSPVETHKDFWQPPEVKKDENPPVVLDTKSLLEAAVKTDFSRVIDKETVAKVAKGGDEAVEAMLQLANQIGQAAYGQSLVSTQKMIDKAVQEATTKVNSSLPGQVKRETLNTMLTQDNPNFTNPLVEPVVQAIQNQLANKYPNSSVNELQAMAKEILGGVAGLINPPSKDDGKGSKDSKGNQQNNNNSDKDEDWSSYL